MKPSLILLLLTGLLLAGCSSVDAPPDGVEPDDTSLRALARANGIDIGVAVGTGLQRTDARFAQVLRREFSMLTAENTMKFGPIHPEPTRFAWTEPDALVEFAEANDMAVRGHALLWHQSLPSWIDGGAWTRASLMAAVQEHITTVVTRYKGRIKAWDVLNEGIEGNGTLRQTVFQQVIGPEYIALAFSWAHEADPDALLFYNDYSAEGLGTKSDAVYTLVRDLKQGGIPIHGVGLQMHVSAESPPRMADVRANIRRLGSLGVQVHITEMDVRVRLPATEASWAQQATVYNDVLEVCLDEPACTALVFWGTTDRHSWVPSFFEGYGAALPFDEEYEPKLAYQVMRQTLLSR